MVQQSNECKRGVSVAQTFSMDRKRDQNFLWQLIFLLLREYPQVIGTGKGFEIILCFYEQQASIELRLKLMLKPLRGKIIDTLTDEIKRVL